MEIPKAFQSGNWNARLTVMLGFFTTAGYVLLFILFYPRFGAILASLAVLPVIFIGWRMGLKVGMAAGLLSLPLNMLLFNLAGVNGIGTLVRDGAGLGSFIIVFLGAAAGWVHDVADRLSTQIRINKSTEQDLRRSEERYQGLFEHSPVSLWEEDFSRVKKTIDRLKDKGVWDFDVYFDNHPEAVAECLAMIQVIDINYATLNLYEAGSKDELLNNLNKVFTENTYEIFRQELIAMTEGRMIFEGVGQNCTLSGDTIDIHLRWSVAPGYEDSLSKVFVSIVDITERERAKERLQRQTDQAEALAEISKALSAAGLETQAIFDLIVEHIANFVGDACVLRLIDEDYQSIRVVAFHHRESNVIPLMQQLLVPGLRQVGDGAAGRVVKTGKPLFIPTVSPEGIERMSDPEYEAYLYQTGVHSLLIIPLIAQGQVIGTLEISRHHPGDAFTEEDKSFLQNLANQAALTIVNARLHELVRHQARIDALTGVYNRRHFISLAEMEFDRSERYGKPLSIILLDLDHFKDINDTYGHHTGDRALKYVAERCQANLRSMDIMGRYGGEEFTILLPETNLLGARYLAERLRTHIAKSPVDSGRDLIHVTVSLGIASKTEDTPDLAALLHQADQAMYAGKRAGRNQVALVR